MDMLAHCRAMAAFCRQHARFEDVNDAFWIGEAEEWDKLISEYAILQPKFEPDKQPEAGALQLVIAMTLNCPISCLHK
jgi:hypothetical protein